MCVRSVAQSYPTLCDPMNCSPAGSSDHEVFQAKLLEQVPSPGDLPDPATESGSTPGSPVLAGRFFTTEPPGKPQERN